MNSDWDQRLGFWWIAEDHPEAPAVLASPTGPSTYAELAGRAHQLVHLFRARGLQPGDSIAAIAPNSVPIIELSLACHEAGWYFIPLNTYLTAAETAAILAHSGAAALVVHETFADLVDEIRRGGTTGQALCFAVGSIPGVESLDELRGLYPTTVPTDRQPGGLFTYTSGTTGRPKGIRRPIPAGDPSAIANAASLFGRAFDFTPFDGPHLVSTGMYHGGSHSFYLGALQVGHALVIMERFDPEETLRLIDAHRVTSAYMVPTQFHRLLQLPADVKERYDVSSLKAVVHSAAPCPRHVKEQMLAWWGPVIYETYGGMEGAATIAKPKRWLEKPGTVGRAVKGVTVAILDAEGNDVAANTTGSIYMATTDGFSYHRDEDGTRQAHQGTLFTLGDIGYLDDDGYLFILDRAKDMIITGGVNVYPQEVEGIVLSHPAVFDAGVIGVPDADWGEQVKAVVQLKDGLSPTPELAAEIIEHCRASLAAYKCPRTVDFRDDLPRTEAGKLYKRLIRDEYWAASGRKV